MTPQTEICPRDNRSNLVNRLLQNRALLRTISQAPVSVQHQLSKPNYVMQTLLPYRRHFVVNLSDVWIMLSVQNTYSRVPDQLVL